MPTSRVHDGGCSCVWEETLVPKESGPDSWKLDLSPYLGGGGGRHLCRCMKDSAMGIIKVARNATTSVPVRRGRGRCEEPREETLWRQSRVTARCPAHAADAARARGTRGRQKLAGATSCPLQGPEGQRPCRHLDLGPATPVLDCWLPELSQNELVFQGARWSEQP